MQLFAQDLGPTGNYNAKMDWFYLDYRWQDWLGFRAGRVKIPFGLYNEINDIDSARVPVLLPQSVYPSENRNYLLAQTGAELYGYLSCASAGALDYRSTAGTIFVDTTHAAGSPYQLQSFNVPYLVGRAPALGDAARRPARRRQRADAPPRHDAPRRRRDRR